MRKWITSPSACKSLEKSGFKRFPDATSKIAGYEVLRKGGLRNWLDNAPSVPSPGLKFGNPSFTTKAAIPGLALVHTSMFKPMARSTRVPKPL